MDYIDQNHNRVVIGRQIGRRGGEGCVFEANSHPGHVVKIYHEAPDQAKASKLHYLTQIANESVLKFSAWPKTLVWDGQGKLRGFIMPRVQGKEIHQLFQPKERFIAFPNVRWDFLVTVARNCAAAFDEIHSLGAVIGDVNEGNILVKRDGTISLIDCDSYQIRHQNGYVWTCDVGVALWTPPELQNQKFRGLPRDPNHDLFGLAALIFRMLFMGRHPFAGAPLVPGELDLEKAIREFKYAYSSNAASYHVKPPPNCVPVEVLAKNHRELFEKAFNRGSDSKGARPSAREWTTALDSLSRSLHPCSSDSSHRFPTHLSNCPWCEIARSGGPNYFITVHINPQHTQGVAEIWLTISKIGELTPSGHDQSRIPLIPCQASSLPSPEKTIRLQFILGIMTIALGAFALLSGAALLGIGIITIAVGMMYSGVHEESYSSLRAKRQAALDQSANRWRIKVGEIDAIERDYKRAYREKKEELRLKYQRLLHLEDERKQEMKRLEAKKRQLQLDEFLDRQLLVNARIHGIGPVKQATLLAHGIESALDVVRAHRVPGIGDAFYSRLIDWKTRCEGRFRFNPNQAIPQADIHILNIKFTQVRRSIENELMVGANQLEWMNNKFATAREPIESQLQDIRKLFSQNKIDLEAIPAG